MSAAALSWGAVAVGFLDRFALLNGGGQTGSLVPLALILLCAVLTVCSCLTFCVGCSLGLLLGQLPIARQVLAFLAAGQGGGPAGWL